MNESDARHTLNNILDQLEIGEGETVYLGIDMSGVPLPDYSIERLSKDAITARENQWCNFVYDVLMERLGPFGTLLAPTFSYAYARFGTPYIHETTPSETGPFTEFLRNQTTAIRSLHPLNSISGVGQNASAILEGTGKAGYGIASPFARLRAHDTKFLFLGAPLGISLTHAHHMEHMYGVNHMFHKLYNTPVSQNKKEVPGPWLCFVRYLNVGVEAEIQNLETRMRSLHLLKECDEWQKPMQSCTVGDVESLAIEMLNESPWAFLQAPREIHIESENIEDIKMHQTAHWLVPKPHLS